MIDIEQLSLEYRREKLRALVKFGTFSGYKIWKFR